MSQTTLPAAVAADAAEQWDHVTVTHGVFGRGHRFRDPALALVLALIVGAVAAWIGAAVESSRNAPDAATTSAVSHARLGTVVHSNPHAHPRLGPVVHHGARPRQWKS